MTAVEWLINEITAIDWQDPYWKIKLEKAKEMEEEQMIEFANEYSYAVMGGCLLTPTEFYNETFKSE